MHTDHNNARGIVLFDGCPRCEEHAAHPFDSLDDSNLRLLARFRNEPTTGLSNNDLRAIQNIRRTITQYQRLQFLGGV